MAKQTFTTGQVLTAAQMTNLQQTAMGGGSPSTKTASYVLVAADAGTVIQMNSASSTTITVNTALFSAGDSVFIQNIGAGTCTITAGTATVTTAGSLALTQWEGGTLYFTSASAAIFFDYIQAGVSIPLTTKGDLFGFDTANARVPIGSNGQVLTADSTQALGLKWATASSPTTSFTKLVNGSALSGASITFSSLSGYNKLLLLFVSATSNSAGDLLRLRINGDTASNYNLLEGQITGNNAYSTAVVGANASTGTAAFFFATQSSGSSSASSGYILIDGANSTGDKPYTYAVGSTAGGGSGHKVQTGGGWYSGTSVISNVTIMANAGSLGGSIYIFGGN